METWDIFNSLEMRGGEKELKEQQQQKKLKKKLNTLQPTYQKWQYPDKQKVGGE